MKRLMRVLSQSECPFLVFFLGFILLNWPFLGAFHSKPLHYIVLYVFLIWGAAVILAFLINRHQDAKGADGTHIAAGRRDHQCLIRD